MSKRKPPSREHLDKAIGTFQQESDRACAILGAAHLDELLGISIKRKLVRGEEMAEKLVFAVNAPLGSFSSRIDAAFAMGIIDHDAHRELDQIRRIRNIFAHRLDIHSFKESSELSTCLSRLSRGLAVADRYEEPTRSDLKTARLLFVSSVCDLIAELNVSAGFREVKEDFVVMSKKRG